MGATGVIGREVELGLIEAFLVGVEQGPAALVLSGEAGIGKTALWEIGVGGGAAVRAYGPRPRTADAGNPARPLKRHLR
jgi:hypothetical protein